MTKTFKSFFYIIACAFVFMLLVNAYNTYSSQSFSQKANAFEWEKKVKVYFVDSKKMETSSCEADVALDRTVINAETLGPGAIEALLNGLTAEEKSMYSTAIKKGTLLQKFEVKNGVAYVDFSSELNKEVAGSCTVTAIRSQIEKTLIALPDIDSVVISVNGKTEGILEP